MILRLLTIAILLISSLTFVANNALASKKNNNDLPGWGWGDINHDHKEPRGHSVNIHDDDERPGWGHGDKHHEHKGPWGHSVNIHNDEQDDNDVNEYEKSKQHDNDNDDDGDDDDDDDDENHDD